MKLPILLSFIILSYSSQDVEIPIRNYGLTVGDIYGSLHIQLFFDFLCEGCKDHFGTWADVRKEINLKSHGIKLTYQFNPLPYHFYSILLTEGFNFIHDQEGNTEADKYMTYIFEHQEDFDESNYLDKTLPEFISEFSLRIGKEFRIQASDLAAQLNIGSKSWTELRNNWRYSTIERGISGTPMFYANGVRIDGAESFEKDDWINFMNKYRQ